MARHNHTGTIGEELGTGYLSQQGYQVLARNWRHAHWEVDIIATKDTVLHFMEIKTRRTKNFGHPEETVGRKKVQNLINAAEQYLFLHPEWQRIQFNILSILITRGAPVEYFLIEDVHL